MHNSLFFFVSRWQEPLQWERLSSVVNSASSRKTKGTTTLLIKPFWSIPPRFLPHARSILQRIFWNYPIFPSLCPENITPGDYTNYLLSQESHGSSGNNKCVIHSAATSLFLQTAFKLPFINHCLRIVCDQNSSSPFIVGGEGKAVFNLAPNLYSAHHICP